MGGTGHGIIHPMPEFSKTITEYWRRLFAEGEVIRAGQGLAVAINAKLAPQRRVMLLHLADGSTQMALSPDMADRVLPELGRRPLSLEHCRARLSRAGVMLHGPDRLFYYPEPMEPWPRIDGEQTARKLSSDDKAAFAAFQAEAPAQDREDAFVELDHWATFGLFEGSRLASVASIYPWDDTRIVDLGVLTLPVFRGRGYARSLVHSVSRYALSHGYQPQYRCQLDNRASTALAHAAGLLLFGIWEVVASSDDDAPH